MIHWQIGRIKHRNMEHMDRNSVNVESFTDFNKIISTNKIQMLHENTFQLHKRQTNLIFHNNITFSGEGGFTFTVSASSTLKGSSMCFGSLGVITGECFPSFQQNRRWAVRTPTHRRISNVTKRQIAAPLPRSNVAINNMPETGPALGQGKQGDHSGSPWSGSNPVLQAYKCS